MPKFTYACLARFDLTIEADTEAHAHDAANHVLKLMLPGDGFMNSINTDPWLIQMHVKCKDAQVASLPVLLQKEKP